jgi:hypothetical protein
MNRILPFQVIRIVLPIATKVILDAIKKKGTISVLISALFLSFIYSLFPIRETEDIILIYDTGESTWISALEDGSMLEINIFESQKAIQYRLSRIGESKPGVVLGEDFDQALMAGGLMHLQGYLRNWVNEKQAPEKVSQVESQIIGVVNNPVNITVKRLFILPETTGTFLGRGMGVFC